jgi:prepilin-type N-terminal cleavage/methylation domain-containing protein
MNSRFTTYDLRFTHRSISAKAGEEALTCRSATALLPRQSEAKPGQRFNASTFSPRRSGAKAGQRQTAFTLIELLVVIAIAVIIAALLITAGGAVVNNSNIQRAMSERDQLVLAIDAYHDKYGFYPPANAFGNGLTNQLYYELLGTIPATNGGEAGFTTLDGATFISSSAVLQDFGVSAFVNSSKGSGDDATPAKTFLPGLKYTEMASNSPPSNPGNSYTFIVTAANSDSVYQPMPGVYSLAGRLANPWRYVCPGTNNPNSYDLWTQVFVGNKTNLVCNWAKQKEINVPLP